MNLAPNGKPTNLTPEQYRLVRTTAFKEWFGDWQNDAKNSSKVIDENGEPLVVYHGTKNEFSIFTENRFIYTSDSMDYQKKLFTSKSERIFELFGNSKNILDLTEFGIYEADLKKLNKFFEEKSINFIATKNKMIYGFFTFKEITIEMLKQAGYDGVRLVFESEYKGLIGYSDKVDYSGYIFINPTQIKLADGTNTTFDSNNPDIRYADGGEILWNIKGAKDEFLSAKELFKIDEKKFWRERYLPKLEKNILSNSELNEDEWRLVNSENFIKWFGDWRKYNQKHSLVLNTLFYDDGDKGFFYNEPQIVYHASYNDFNEFNKLFIQNDTGFFGRGFYFGTTYHQVIEYGRIIKKYFINLRNPFYFEGTEIEFAKKLNLTHLLEYDKEYDKYYLTNEFSEEVTKYLISENYDGLIINSTFGKEVIAFYPNQIKLADGSNTTFDGNNPDIRYADGGSIPDSLSSQEVENKLGRELHWWNDDIVYLSGIEYKKVYLKNEYKKIN